MSELRVHLTHDGSEGILKEKSNVLVVWPKTTESQELKTGFRKIIDWGLLKESGFGGSFLSKIATEMARNGLISRIFSFDGAGFTRWNEFNHTWLL